MAGLRKVCILLFASFLSYLSIQNVKPDEITTKRIVPLKGVCYSPFRDNQSPETGNFPSLNEISEDLNIIEKYAENIRTYGNDNVLFEIPRLCDEKNIRIDVGAWLSRDYSFNNESINNLIQIANSGYKSVKGLIVGSETLLRNDLTKAELISYINQVKNSTSIPVTTAEGWYFWLNNRDLADYVDYLTVHIHPYWEGVSIDNAVSFVIEKYNLVKSTYPDKRVVIGETGWPSGGAINKASIPSEENQVRFVREFRDAAARNNIDYFIFEMFDEKWKEKYGEVEGHWGIFYSSREIKPLLEDALSVFSRFD